MKHKQITVIVGCLIKDGKVLLSQRREEECKGAHLKWELPGGKVNFDETPEQAIRREFLEETGVAVRVGSLLPFVFTNNWHYDWGVQHTLVFGFLCRFVKKIGETGDHHIIQTRWIPLNQVAKLETLPGVKEFIAIAAGA